MIASGQGNPVSRRIAGRRQGAIRHFRIEARRLTRLEFGGTEQIKEDCRESRGTMWLESLVQESDTVCDNFEKSPGFAFIAISLPDAGHRRQHRHLYAAQRDSAAPLPVQNPGEVASIRERPVAGQHDLNSRREHEAVLLSPLSRFSPERYFVFRKSLRVDSSQFATRASIGGAAYQTTHVDLVSGSYFSVLGVPAFLGRTIGESDDSAEGAGPFAVASYSWFQRQFNGDPSALGKTIRIQSHDYTLSAYAAAGLSTDTRWANRLTCGFRFRWRRRSLVPAGTDSEINSFSRSILIGRLKPGMSPTQASAETNLLFKQILRSYLGSQPPQKHLDDIAHASIQLTPGGRGVSYLRYAFSVPLEILMAIVAAGAFDCLREHREHASGPRPGADA